MNTNASLYNSIVKSKMVYYNYREMPENDNETHLRAFNSNAEVVEHYKGSLFNEKALIKH